MQTLARAALGRWTIGALNVVVFAIVFATILDVIELMRSGLELKEAEDILQGINVILIGYGVMLEERDSLREMAGIAGGAVEGSEAAIDRGCHDAGVLLIVLGVLTEIAIECIKIPDRIINTAGAEGFIVGFAVAIDVLVLVVLAVHIVKMATYRSAAPSRR